MEFQYDQVYFNLSTDNTAVYYTSMHSVSIVYYGTLTTLITL